MFSKVLVANRGEIACRIFRSLRKLGVRSVAVYSDADRSSRHVLEADEAVRIGPATVAQSYLNVDAIARAALQTGSQAIHPGYGFLSENPDFCANIESQGVCFVGPTPSQLKQFGLKHEARALAQAEEVPLLPGTGLLGSVEEAQQLAAQLGFPLMLKSTAGGGGIGMQLCRDLDQLPALYSSVRGLAQKNFADGGLFLERFVERARHIEVQIFGDGKGQVIALGERDCSAQRRNQKVIEEAPAPGLSTSVRSALHAAAVRLGQAVKYRSAGTVEFVYDEDRKEFYFLEVNTRLQVEHGVTELVYGVDLVEWMLKLAAGDPLELEVPNPKGHAFEVRIYAEDPARNFRPCAGLLTEVSFPETVRVDSWIERGTEVPSYYDPMLAKVLTHGESREEALTRLQSALAQTRISGIETNLGYLRNLSADPVVQSGLVTTAHLGTLTYASPTVEVLEAGTMTTVQDYPGRIGYWDVGVPPSGPMDDLSFRLANLAVGNPVGTAALEITFTGPALLFATDATVALAGAELAATLDGLEVPTYEPIQVRAGQTLKLGAVRGEGARAYLAFRGGLDVPSYLGSRATFTLGLFGGHAGRALRRGDILHLAGDSMVLASPRRIEELARPRLSNEWHIAVIYGPHGAPDFFTDDDIATFFAHNWEVHYNSARTGVRLIGPKPIWARPDGGEAGLHPSNLHDNAYAVGTVDFTGDMPIILGPDGPSLGGFVCPATVVAAERWKLGQLRPGAKVKFTPISFETAAALAACQRELLEGKSAVKVVAPVVEAPVTAVLREQPAGGTGPSVCYRPSGDEYLLVEYGAMVLDLALRFRVHQLMQRVSAHREMGILDLTPGIRSLQVHYNPRKLPLGRLLKLLEELEAEIVSADSTVVQTRVVHLPLSFDDPATRLAIEKYMQGVRKDAPWTPSNLEFIRRINGLESEDSVRKIVFDASYLVLGLGDVYLGAPVATPIDPRHRLVTTKYNPARTWTPENAVGIGGAYLCIYGMEGPGGYQFVGRTLQVYNRFKTTPEFVEGTPWLLRFFDQIRFYQVDAKELLEMREAFPHGRVPLQVTTETFSLSAYQAGLKRDETSISAFKKRQQQAFEEERQRWLSAPSSETSKTESEADTTGPVAEAEGTVPIESHVHGSVWKVRVSSGDWVKEGQTLVVVESMKMEIAIDSPIEGRVRLVSAAEGLAVCPGQTLLRIEPKS